MENENSKKDNDGKTLKVSVKQFCASCGYKRVRNNGTRYCKRRRRRVKQKGVCQYWTLADLYRRLRIKH